jgi:hypothetical protein
MAFFGIGAGKFDLQLSHTEASPGGKIQGTVVMTINSDMEAKGVIIDFWGERKVQIKDEKGKLRNQTVVVYKQTKTLDEERLYQKEESKTYAFSFDVPPDIGGYETSTTSVVPGGQIYGEVIASGGGPVAWFVKVRLDMPFSFEVSKKQQIRIVAAPSGAPGPMQ